LGKNAVCYLKSWGGGRGDINQLVPLTRDLRVTEGNLGGDLGHQPECLKEEEKDQSGLIKQRRLDLEPDDAQPAIHITARASFNGAKRDTSSGKRSLKRELFTLVEERMSVWEDDREQMGAGDD